MSECKDSSSESDTSALMEIEMNNSSLQCLPNSTPFSDEKMECNMEPGSNFVGGLASQEQINDVKDVLKSICDTVSSNFEFELTTGLANEEIEEIGFFNSAAARQSITGTDAVVPTSSGLANEEIEEICFFNSAAARRSITGSDETIQTSSDPSSIPTRVTARNMVPDENPSLNFDDNSGTDFIKTAIKKMVIVPFLRPDLFCGLSSPPNSLLLFGPPGTGKSFLGKVLASEVNAPFFCINASSLTSNYTDQGEDLIRKVFTDAKLKAPSVIFFDDIDLLLIQRSEGVQDLKKLKKEFLVQFDEATTSNEDRILVIGTTNRPQELDEAARRRFVKRLYVPLPKFHARRHMIGTLLSKYSCNISTKNLNRLNRLSCALEGYSCADILNLFQEAAMGPIRSSYAVLPTISSRELKPICITDFKEAMKRIKPSVCETDLLAHLEFNEKFGCNSF